MPLLYARVAGSSSLCRNAATTPTCWGGVRPCASSLPHRKLVTLVNGCRSSLPARDDRENRGCLCVGRVMQAAASQCCSANCKSMGWCERHNAGSESVSIGDAESADPIQTRIFAVAGESLSVVPKPKWLRVSLSLWVADRNAVLGASVAGIHNLSWSAGYRGACARGSGPGGGGDVRLEGIGAATRKSDGRPCRQGHTRSVSTVGRQARVTHFRAARSSSNWTLVSAIRRPGRPTSHPSRPSVPRRQPACDAAVL